MVNTEVMVELIGEDGGMGTEIAFRQNNHFLTGDAVFLQGFAYDLFGFAIGVDVGLGTRSAIGRREIEARVSGRLRTVSQVFNPTL